MKTKSLYLLLMAYMPLLAQYTARIRTEYWIWQPNGAEEQGTLYADLLYNGQPQLPDTVNYTYTWYGNESGTYQYY